MFAFGRNVDEWQIRMDANDIEPALSPMIEYLTVARPPEPEPAPAAESVAAEPAAVVPALLPPAAEPGPVPQPTPEVGTPEPTPAPEPQAVPLSGSEPILFSPGTPCVVDLRPILGAEGRYVLHWGDGHDRVYYAEELQRLSGLLMHTYAEAGLYQVTVDVEDETGMHRNVAAWPVAVFAPRILGPASAVVGQEVSFRAGTTGAAVEGPPCFSWQVRNGSGQTIQQVGWTWTTPRPELTFTPVEAGWHTIFLTIQDGEGKVQVIHRSLRVQLSSTSALCGVRQ